MHPILEKQPHFKVPYKKKQTLKVRTGPGNWVKVEEGEGLVHDLMMSMM